MCIEEEACEPWTWAIPSQCSILQGPWVGKGLLKATLMVLPSLCRGTDRINRVCHFCVLWFTHGLQDGNLCPPSQCGFPHTHPLVTFSGHWRGWGLSSWMRSLGPEHKGTVEWSVLGIYDMGPSLGASQRGSKKPPRTHCCFFCAYCSLCFLWGGGQSHMSQAGPKLTV